jgi:hypothetical protein
MYLLEEKCNFCLKKKLLNSYQDTVLCRCKLQNLSNTLLHYYYITGTLFTLALLVALIGFHL